MKQTLIDI
jgi:hypothetical protein